MSGTYAPGPRIRAHAGPPGHPALRYWFSAIRDEQRLRFEVRETDPPKRRKLSPIDWVSPDQWDDDTEAKGAMSFHADAADASWTIAKSNDRTRAWPNCMRHFPSALAHPDKDPTLAALPAPPIVGHASKVIHAAKLIWAPPCIRINGGHRWKARLRGGCPGQVCCRRRAQMGLRIGARAGGRARATTLIGVRGCW